MKPYDSKQASPARFLNLNLSLTLSPVGPESKIEMTIMIKRADG